MSLSYFAARLSTSLALLLPSSARVLSLVRLNEENAVSVAEKNAENKMHTSMPIIYDTICPSVKFIIIFYTPLHYIKHKKIAPKVLNAILSSK